MANDPKLVKPTDGWRLPNESDVNDLHSFTTRSGVFYTDGGKLKSTSADFWNAPNKNAENLFGFDVRGGGLFYSGNFAEKKNSSYFWTSSINNYFAFDTAIGTSSILQTAFLNELS